MDKVNKNQIDQTLYNAKSLSLLNIRELRDMGRKFGVPSPTTLKKQELVEYILKIVYGEIEAPSRTNYGRPNSRDFDLPKYLEKIKKNSDMASELIKVKLDQDFENMIVSSPVEEYKVEENIETRVLFSDNGKYFLRVHQFVESPRDIEISSEIVNKYNLENLDIIEIIEAGEFFKIITINGISVGGKHGELIVNGKPLKGGDNQVFYLSTKEEIVSSIKELVNKINFDDTKLLIFSTEKYLEDEECNAIYDKNEENSKIYKRFMNLIKTCEKYANFCEDIVLVIENANDVQNMLDSFEKSVSERIKKHLKEMLSKFLVLENILITYKIEEDFNY